MQIHNKLRYVFCLTIWITLLATFYIWFFESEEGIAGILLFFYNFLITSWWGPLLFILIASSRSLLLLPAALFNLLAGVLFGFWFGLLYVLISATVSATIIYLFGRFSSNLTAFENKQVIAMEKFIQHTPFMSVFAGHLLFLPFDVVNYAAGFLRINFKVFLAGMFSGSLFGIITIVSLGASLDVIHIQQNGMSFDAFDHRLLLWSLIIFISVVFLSYIIKMRKP